jgi:hypothetical protein
MQIERIEYEDYVVYGYYKGYFTWHREDGPAVERSNGTKIWYLHGKLHRENGPAIEYANGDKAWYLEGKEIKEKDFEKAVKLYKLSKICK